MNHEFGKKETEIFRPNRPTRVIALIRRSKLVFGARLSDTISAGYWRVQDAGSRAVGQITTILQVDNARMRRTLALLQ
ncbi:hypothetical protein [Bradyrhizobium sp. STM 3557]|uniref:hypothetical protein n=1 Tax=Bradyrhizobium sp. STM 3557 TaxID=578920 RepID=UPI00388E8FDF